MARLLSMVLLVLICGCIPEWQRGNSSGSSVQQKPVVSIVSLQGQIAYEDRFYNHLGFVNSAVTLKTISGLEVELITDDGVYVGSTTTNEVGTYYFDAIESGNYLLRLLAQTVHDSGAVIQINDHAGALYAIEVPITLADADLNQDVMLTVNDRVAGIFNMLDVFDAGYDFIWSISGNQMILDDLNVFWTWGNDTGSFTCHQQSACNLQAGIYVLSDLLYSGDTDEFDDDVLWHELAHHLEGSLSIGNSPGGVHSLQSQTLDLRLAWSEGFASYFATSVKKWLRENQPQRLSIPNILNLDLTDYYIDNVASGTAVSLDVRQASTNLYRYATNEVAVASTLLTLEQNYGRNSVWTSVFDFLPVNSTADTLESFWDGIIFRNSPDALRLSQWQNLLMNRSVQYQLDSRESDNSINSAKPISDQVLSLYRNHYSTDTDWFSLPVTTGINYVIETYDLRNGADTQIELFYEDGSAVTDPQGNPILNDDAFECELQPGGCSPLHNGSNFSSRIDFTAASDATLYVKVVTSPWVFNDPQSYGYIGRYGSYKIRVTETF